jgi:hypothetical protein
MKQRHRNAMVGLLVGWSFGLAGSASAGPYVNVMQPCDCPPNHYSAFQIITPTFYRWAAWCQGPCRYTFARVLHPDLAPTYYIKPYHCPSVNPLQFALENYPGMNGTTASSTYQSTQESARSQRSPSLLDLQPKMGEKAPAPEQLPSPREEPDKK